MPLSIPVEDVVNGQIEERDLVQRAVAGDPQAAAQLYRRYAPAIFRYLFYRLGQRETAEDLTSEVFCRALKALPRYEQRGLPFSAWLYRIAGARAADLFRWRRRHPTAGLSPTMASGDHDPVQETNRRLDAETLQAALAQLSADQQQVILLRFVEELPHAEVGRIMGKSEGATRALQYRALVALRRILEE